MSIIVLIIQTEDVPICSNLNRIESQWIRFNSFSNLRDSESNKFEISNHRCFNFTRLFYVISFMHVSLSLSLSLPPSSPLFPPISPAINLVSALINLRTNACLLTYIVKKMLFILFKPIKLQI